MLYCTNMHNAAVKKQNQKTTATIYHQHVIKTKFHDFSSVTEKTGRCR